MESTYHSEAFIWKYLQGELSKEEQEAFSAVLDKDEDLQERLSEEIIRHYGRLAFKKRLQAIDHQVQSEFNPLSSGPFWKMAAMVLLLLIPVLVWRSYSHKQQDRIDLFQAAFIPYMHQDSSLYTQADSTLNAKWISAISFYEDKKYVKAIPLFKELIEEDSSQQEVYHFYLGMSYLTKTPQKLEAAITSFKQAADKEHPLQGQARWYLALAYWENGDKEKAMKIFQQISTQAGAFNQKMASDVLSRYIQ
ncbi:MAG: tetratricopeptide repeat protein [Bacteroidota bacterium]